LAEGPAIMIFIALFEVHFTNSICWSYPL